MYLSGSTVPLPYVQQFCWLPGIPTSTCSQRRPRRRCLAQGVPRVAAYPRTPVRSSPAPPRCRRNPRLAVYQWCALYGARNVGARGYFEKLASSLPSWLSREVGGGEVGGQ